MAIARTDGRLFAPRPRILELGYSFLSSIRLREIAQPRLDELVARVHESSSCRSSTSTTSSTSPAPRRAA